MRRISISVLLALAAAPLGCDDKELVDLQLRKAMRTVPTCWQPYLQAEQPVLARENIVKGCVVIKSSYPRQSLVVYDRRSDRCQSYRIPKHVIVFADYPHVWWVGMTGKGRSRYWNTKTGRFSVFPDLPPEPFSYLPQGPVDTGSRPYALVAKDKCWSWVPSAKTYRVFDALQKRWQDLPKAGDLPPGRAVLGALETKDSIRLSLGPRVYCTMRPSLAGYETFLYDKAAAEWSIMSGIPQVHGAQVVRASKGWWVLQQGSGCWVAPGARYDMRGPWYGMVSAGGKLWGWQKDRIVEVTGVDAKTGTPIPPLTPTAQLRGRFVYDGQYLWSWTGGPMGPVARYTPGAAEPRQYRTVVGLKYAEHSVRLLAFTSRAIWFGSAARYDKAKEAWTEMRWTGRAPPEGLFPIGGAGAVCEDETFLHIGRPGQPYDPRHWAGIARYDPKTDTATYYTAEQVARGDWPYGGPVEYRSSDRRPEQVLARKVALAWNRVLEERGLPAGRRPRSRAGEVVSVKNGKLGIRNLHTGAVETHDDHKFGLPTILTADAAWYLVGGGLGSVVLDRKTGRATRLGQKQTTHMVVHRYVRGGDEVWFNWYDRRDKPVLGQRRPVGSAVLNLKTRTVTVLPPGDAAPFGSPLTIQAIDEKYLWASYFDKKAPARRFSGLGRGAGFITAKNRKTGRWLRIPYLDGEQIWFDGKYVYANINRRFHRAEKSAFLRTLEKKSRTTRPGRAGVRSDT